MFVNEDSDLACIACGYFIVKYLYDGPRFQRHGCRYCGREDIPCSWYCADRFVPTTDAIEVDPPEELPEVRGPDVVAELQALRALSSVAVAEEDSPSSLRPVEGEGQTR